MAGEKKPEQTYSFLFQLATLLFIGLFFPLTILLFMIPNSWYSAEGYEDLGIMEFEAYKAQTRGKGINNHYVFYEAVDGSGLSFREGKMSRITAYRVVENKERVRRHVYRTYDSPNFILGMFRNAGYHYFQEGKEPQSREEFQQGLDRARKITLMGKSAGLCYIGAYGAVILLKRRKRVQEAQN